MAQRGSQRPGLQVLVVSTLPESTQRKESASLAPADPPRSAVPAYIEEVHAQVARSRRAQGLPPRIEDSEVLDRAAAVFALTDKQITAVRPRVATQGLEGMRQAA